MKEHPNTKSYCFEPCKENYEALCSAFPDSSIHNYCLGDNTPLYMNLRSIDSHYFTEAAVDGSYAVESKRLNELVDLIDVDMNKKTLFIIDTEGGERFLIDHKPSEEIMKQSTHLGLEIHYPNNSRKFKHFNEFPSLVTYLEWMRDTFSETHHVHFNNFCPTSGLGIFVLARKVENV